ncbi:MAG: hypothetical protein V3W37_08085 [Candidatus Binatia bacterium]
MVKITVRERGTRAAIKSMLGKSRYLATGLGRRLRQVAETVGVDTVRQAITASGIKSRTGALLSSVEVLESRPTEVVIGFSTKRSEEIADTLDMGTTLPGIPFRVGVTIPLAKGASEGLVFRRSVGPRTIRAFGWSRRAVERLERELPNRFEVLISKDIGEGV